MQLRGEEGEGIPRVQTTERIAHEGNRHVLLLEAVLLILSLLSYPSPAADIGHDELGNFLGQSRSSRGDAIGRSAIVARWLVHDNVRPFFLRLLVGCCCPLLLPLRLIAIPIIVSLIGRHMNKVILAVVVAFLLFVVLVAAALLAIAVINIGRKRPSSNDVLQGSAQVGHLLLVAQPPVDQKDVVRTGDGAVGDGRGRSQRLELADSGGGSGSSGGGGSARRRRHGHGPGPAEQGTSRRRRR